MDRSGRIDAAYRKLRRTIDEEQSLAVKPLKGKFKTIVIDPPWQYSGAPERVRPVYATMTQKELLALPVFSWADDPAHLYLWSTNADLRDAFELLEVWGFKFKTMITWVKTSFGIGSYFRTSTEHGQRRGLDRFSDAERRYHSVAPALGPSKLSELP
jgi:MT-A70